MFQLSIRIPLLERSIRLVDTYLWNRRDAYDLMNDHDGHHCGYVDRPRQSRRERAPWPAPTNGTPKTRSSDEIDALQKVQGAFLVHLAHRTPTSAANLFDTFARLLDLHSDIENPESAAALRQIQTASTASVTELRALDNLRDSAKTAPIAKKLADALLDCASVMCHQVIAEFLTAPAVDDSRPDPQAS